MHTRQRGDACQFRAPADDHGAAQETLPRAVPISVPSAGGVDVRTDPELVSIPHPGGVERERVAGAADAAGKLKVPASRQLFRVDRRLCAGASADEPTSADALGGVMGVPGPAVKSPARIDFCQYPLDYYWTCEQIEWASDVVFRRAEFLRRLMPRRVRHGMLSFHSPDVMRFLGKKVNQSGAVPGNFHGDLQMDLKRRQEGERVKFYMNGNSAKFYDKSDRDFGNVL